MNNQAMDKLKQLFEQFHTDRPLYPPEAEAMPEEWHHCLQIFDRPFTQYKREEKEAAICFLIPPFYPAIYHEEDDFLLYYAAGDNAEIFVNDLRRTLQKGDVCFLAPHTVHAVGVNNAASCVYRCSIESDNLQGSFAAILQEESILRDFMMEALYFSRRNSALFFHTKGEAPIASFAEFAKNEYEKKEKNYNLMIVNLVQAMFILLLRRYADTAELPQPENEKATREVLLFLNEMQRHFDSITLGDLARKYHYSERHVTRMLKEHTGLGFKELVTKMRMLRSIELLKNPHLSLAQVAEQVGYTDTASFSKKFREEYHMSPNDYRSVSR